MWSDMRVFSCVKDGEILIWCVYLPLWVIVSKYREYKASITILIPIRIIMMFDYEMDDITTNNHLIKLIVGGRAKFVRLASNHQVAINGRNVCRSQARIIVWLWIRL